MCSRHAHTRTRTHTTHVAGIARAEQRRVAQRRPQRPRDLRASARCALKRKRLRAARSGRGRRGGGRLEVRHLGGGARLRVCARVLVCVPVRTCVYVRVTNKHCAALQARPPRRPQGRVHRYLTYVLTQGGGLGITPRTHLEVRDGKVGGQRLVGRVRRHLDHAAQREGGGHGKGQAVLRGGGGGACVRVCGVCCGQGSRGRRGACVGGRVCLAHGTDVRGQPGMHL